MLIDDLDHNHTWIVVVAVVSLVAAFGFLLYGGRCELYSLFDWMELSLLKHVVSHFQFPFKFFHSLLFLCLLWDIEVFQSLVSWWVQHRLFLMLRRFPIESKGRRKKLREVCLIYLSSFLFLILPHGNKWYYCFFAVLYSWYRPYSGLSV
jgi:hypothetical protein